MQNATHSTFQSYNDFIRPKLIDNAVYPDQHDTQSILTMLSTFAPESNELIGLVNEKVEKCRRTSDNYKKTSRGVNNRFMGVKALPLSKGLSDQIVKFLDTHLTK